jgi:hypothetical protein
MTSTKYWGYRLGMRTVDDKVDLLAGGHDLPLTCGFRWSIIADIRYLGTSVLLSLQHRFHSACKDMLRFAIRSSNSTHL